MSSSSTALWLAGPVSGGTDDCGFEIVPAPTVAYHHCYGAVRTTYKYENKTTGMQAMCYTCNDQVSYLYRGFYSAYHGAVFEDGPEKQQIALKFDCLGRANRLKTTVVLKRKEKFWQGCDYAGRAVSLTELAKDIYCEECKVWRTHEETY